MDGDSCPAAPTLPLNVATVPCSRSLAAQARHRCLAGPLLSACHTTLLSSCSTEWLDELNDASNDLVLAASDNGCGLGIFRGPLYRRVRWTKRGMELKVIVARTDGSVAGI